MEMQNQAKIKTQSVMITILTTDAAVFFMSIPPYSRIIIALTLPEFTMFVKPFNASTKNAESPPALQPKGFPIIAKAIRN